MSYLPASDASDIAQTIEDVFGVSFSDADLATVTNSRTEFISKWNTQVLPALAGSNQVPAQFVIDVIDSLLTAQGELSNLQMKVLQDPRMVVGEALRSGVLRVLAEASTLPDFLIRDKLNPILFQAIAAKNSDGDAATVAIDIEGPDRFDSLVLQYIDANAQAIATLQAAEFAASQIAGPLGKIIAKAIIKVVKATDELIKVIIAVGEKIYQTVDTLARVVDFMIKATVVGGGLYIAYVLFKPKEKQNPARRRRRRRGRR